MLDSLPRLIVVEGILEKQEASVGILRHSTLGWYIFDDVSMFGINYLLDNYTVYVPTDGMIADFIGKRNKMTKLTK